MGTSVGTEVYLKYGWRPSGALALGFYGLQLILLFLRGHKVSRKTWLGWKNESAQTTDLAPTPPKAREPITKDLEGQETRGDEKNQV
jgi:hypothetical protein